MSLLAQLVLRLLAVGLVCLACAAVWIVHDTNTRLRAEARISAERVAHQIAHRAWLGSAGVAPAPSFYDWQAQATVAMVLPGVCVEFGPTDQPTRRRCTGWAGLGSAPGWFRFVFDRVYGADRPVSQPIVFRGDRRGTATAYLDPAAAVARTWEQVKILLGVAAAMALGMCTLSATAIGHALRPAQRIIQGLRRLEKGELKARIPETGALEFSRIAHAFNDLAGALEQATADRAALTQRLFEVQETERRNVARELHDEFGQCLTATSALAASIDQAVADEKPDLAEDARAITRIAAQMMASLKGALVRLRPPDLEEIGLEASLRSMIAGWNLRGGNTRFSLVLEGNLAAVSQHEALNIYRIVQESLTNAMRHGNPDHVTVKLTSRGGSVSLIVEDDGGGDPEQVASASGFGILGIRERIAALGGSLSIGTSLGGLRLAASIPSQGERPKLASPRSSLVN